MLLCKSSCAELKLLSMEDEDKKKREIGLCRWRVFIIFQAEKKWEDGRMVLGGTRLDLSIRQATHIKQQQSE